MFQDIMTAVTGILILIVILQIIQVNDAPSKTTENKAATAEQREVLKKLQEQLQAAEEEDVSLRRKLRESAQQQESDTSPMSSAEIAGQIASSKQQLQQLESDLVKEKKGQQDRDSAVGLAQDEQNLTASEQKAAASKSKSASLDQQKKDDQSEVQSLEVKLHDAEELQKRLYLIPDEAQTSKEPVVAVVSQTGIEFSRFNHPTDSKRVSNVDDEDTIGRAIDSYSSGDQYFVFYIKPSGVSVFQKLYKIALGKGFDVGFDAIEENQHIIVAQPPGSDADEVKPVPIPQASGDSAINGGSQEGTSSNAASTNSASQSVTAPTNASPSEEPVPAPPAVVSEVNTATNAPTSSPQTVGSTVQTTNVDQPDQPASSTTETASAAAHSQVKPSPLPWILIAVAILIAAVLAYFFVRNK